MAITLPPRILIAAASVFLALQSACAQVGTTAPASPGAPKSFEECVAQSGKVLKSYPARCVTADGVMFIDASQEKKTGSFCKDLCGDGQCQEIVCMAEGCPCAETPGTCPKDCK